MDPILGGFSDDELSESQQEAKNAYKYPTWSAGHDGCNVPNCHPDHYSFTGSPGSTSASFAGKAVGNYTVSVNCGSEENPDDPNDNYGTRRRFIRVCNPVAVASFDVVPNSEGQKVISDLSPCSSQLIKITFGADMNNAPEGERAFLSIEADPKTYELYKDSAGMINSRIWYCERKIDPTGLTDEDIQSISAKNIQHAYLMKIYNQ